MKPVVIPIVSVLAFLLLWHFCIGWFDVPDYLVPSPQAVIEALWHGYVGGRFWPHLFTTLTEMSLGYTIGCVTALLLGALVAEWQDLERVLYPFIVALQSMPKVALAPLLLVWLGFGLASKVVLVALICFFPVFINSVVGFKSANPDLLRLYRAFNASRFQIFISVKLPSAADAIFAGLQIAVVMALIGAVVGEFLSARSGLGYLIQSSTLNFDVATMFAAIASLALIGVTLTSLIRLLHRRIVFWSDSFNSETKTVSEQA
ncbi:MAG: ABC transporter permease [Burkholderiales bacterium]